MPRKSQQWQDTEDAEDLELNTRRALENGRPAGILSLIR